MLRSGPAGAAEPQRGGKGQQGTYFLGIHPARASLSRFSPPSQPTFSAHTPNSDPGAPTPNLGVGGQLKRGPGAAGPRRFCRAEHRGLTGGGVSWAGAGVGEGERGRGGEEREGEESRGKGRRAEGRGGVRGGRRGCVPGAGEAASGRRGSDRLALCGGCPALCRVPRARPRLSSPSHRSGADEMRGGGAGVALLASLLWVAAQCQQRGELRSPAPDPGGRGGCGTKPAALPLRRFLGRCAHPSSPPTRGWHTWVSRAAPGKRLRAGPRRSGDATRDGRSPLLRAFCFKLLGPWGSHPPALVVQECH